MLWGLILLLSLIKPAGLIAQAPDINIQNTIGSYYDDLLMAIDKTPDGGYVLCGFSGSTPGYDKSEYSSDFDYWVVKVNSGGVVQWENTIIAEGHDWIYDISTTPTGHFLLAGYTTAGIGGDKTLPPLGGTDFWIMELDENGNILWQKVLGGPLDDEAEVILPLDGGDILVAGSSWSGGTGDLTDPGNGQIDLCFFKLNADHDIVWQQTIGGNMYDAVTDVKATPDGGFIVAAYSNSWESGEKTEGNYVSWDYWILKLDADGNIEWQNTTGGNDVDRPYSVAVCPDGGYVVNGESTSPISGEKTETSIGNDYWAVKFDALGNIEWQNTIGGTEFDAGTTVIAASDGGMLIGGYSLSSVGIDKTDFLRGIYDYWVLKLDDDGNILWQKTIGGTGSDQLYEIMEIEAGNYALAGWSTSNIGYEKTENAHGNADYWLVTIGTDTITCSVPWVENIYIQPTRAAVVWNETPSELGVRARYRAIGATTWNYAFSNAGKNYVVLRDLTCNTDYEYQLMRICAADGSDYSDFGFMVYFNTPDCREDAYPIENELLIYPNPANDHITISLSMVYEYDVPIGIFTTSGQVCRQTVIPAGSDQLHINTSDLPSGVYFIICEMPDAVRSYSVVIEQ